MDEFLQTVLKAGIINSLRMDENVARQAVMDTNRAAGLMAFSFVRDATEVSIPEAYAIQGLAASHLPRDVAGLQTAAGSPAQGMAKAA